LPCGKEVFTEEYRLLDDLGAVWIRDTFKWETLQKGSKRCNFKRYDAYVTRGKAAGKKILSVLGYDVGWIYGEAKPRRNIIHEKIPYFLQYVDGVVKRYKGKVDAFELWNEPNWLFWKGSEDDFITLTKAAAERSKSIDPSIKIVAVSFWRVPEKFLRKMLRDGTLKRVDAVSFHSYAFSPEGASEQYDELKRILDEEGFKGEIWVTEMGYPTNGWYLSRVSEEKRPAAVLKTLACLKNDRNCHPGGKCHFAAGSLKTTCYCSNLALSCNSLPRFVPGNAGDLIFGFAIEAV
jgi:hypothetical protein